MAKQITNDLSWSFSRHSRFLRCLREYYWYSYGSWNGWLGNSPPQSQLAYRLKKMTGVPLYKGELVHKAIKETLLVYQATGKLPKLDQTLKWMQTKAEVDWDMSERNGGIVPKPSQMPAFIEHYYPSHARWLRPSTRDTLIIEAQKMYQTWLTSEHLTAAQHALRDNPKAWIGIEALETFQVLEIPVYVKLDLYYHSSPNELSILDWKTGKVGEQDQEQLLVYALFVSQKLKPVPKQITVTDVYLKTQEDQTTILTKGQSKSKPVLDKIQGSIRDMKKMLKLVSSNTPKPIEEFTQCRTDGGGPCERCSFRELCYGKD